jgi:hypothetical protein
MLNNVQIVTDALDKLQFNVNLTDKAKEAITSFSGSKVFKATDFKRMWDSHCMTELIDKKHKLLIIALAIQFKHKWAILKFLSDKKFLATDWVNKLYAFFKRFTCETISASFGLYIPVGYIADVNAAWTAKIWKILYPDKLTYSHFIANSWAANIRLDNHLSVQQAFCEAEYWTLMFGTCNAVEWEASCDKAYVIAKCSVKASLTRDWEAEFKAGKDYNISDLEEWFLIDREKLSPMANLIKVTDADEKLRFLLLESELTRLKLI